MINGRSGASIHITGTVQGVGFRPFIYGLAHDLNLSGTIRNTSFGVDIEVSGSPGDLELFIGSIAEKAPPLAQIDELRVREIDPNGAAGFTILPSEVIPGESLPLPADVSICADCLQELFNPADRRYRYPFINCTNCGPRYTIIGDLPYDRPLTSMRSFPMCADCLAEYKNPRDRRFHAQPVACRNCGPHVWLETPASAHHNESAIKEARRLLASGEIVALKGLGGYHLACDASSRSAVARLRSSKVRPSKPLAVMMADISVVRQFCCISPEEEEVLTSRQRPIVLLDRMNSPPSGICDEVTPGQSTLGVMLPYTPLHYLLLEPDAGFPQALVMTSGNRRDEPIVIEEARARDVLSEITASILHHNRPILNRADDSVSKIIAGKQFVVRRARGYAPAPVMLRTAGPPVLAVGGELKNTFCLTHGKRAIISPHNGDLDNLESLQAFEKSIEEFERINRVKPEALVGDLHPDYLSSQYADRRSFVESIPLLNVQHHHAHAASCIADNGLPGDEPVIGVAFDGSGLGPDRTIWGGEFLLADYAGFERIYHLKPVPLLGGDLAARQIWRMGYAWLQAAGLQECLDLPTFSAVTPEMCTTLDAMAAAGINSVPTSSMGRLFDAAASIMGVRQTVDYEAQGAIELEAQASQLDCRPYPYLIAEEQVDPRPLIKCMAEDTLSGVPIPDISARFHRTIAQMAAEVCELIAAQSNVRRVVLSGGVWQNRHLLSRTLDLLQQRSFEVHTHSQVPCNDGGLALGQAVLGRHRLMKG
ncbi:MAG: carbamoyltransferase HypF [Anaerolineales bacterium]|nr:carbamoyltransferase HypF [Anaerolineales bacterium]